MYRSPFRKAARQTNAFKKPGNWAAGYHTGEDWVCDSDRTLVAPANGTIIRNEYDKSYGYFIIIRTNDNKVILMAHMASKSSKAKGARVSAGEIVGTMGSTGNSTGAHLHIEIQNSHTWAYNQNLLKPGAYINFNSFTTGGTFEMAKTWTNGSTKEEVFADTALNVKIGTLNPREVCDCLAVTDGRYLVKYQVGSTGTYKAGFVAYSGGVR